jgi:hypothetical protein
MRQLKFGVESLNNKTFSATQKLLRRLFIYKQVTFAQTKEEVLRTF